jgi:hypothetical protein
MVSKLIQQQSPQQAPWQIGYSQSPPVIPAQQLSEQQYSAKANTFMQPMETMSPERQAANTDHISQVTTEDSPGSNVGSMSVEQMIARQQHMQQLMMMEQQQQMMAQQQQMMALRQNYEKEDARKILERGELDAKQRSEWGRQIDLSEKWWGQEQPLEPAAQPLQPTNAIDAFSTDLGQDSVSSSLLESLPKNTKTSI